MTSATPDRTLSGHLDATAGQLAKYMNTGIAMEAIAVQSIVLLLLQCRALAAALEEAAAERDGHLAMATDLSSVGRGPDDQAQVVDLSGLIRGGRRSAVVLSFPQRGA